MSKAIFFKQCVIYKPDIDNIDEEIVVDKLINCEDNCFHLFKFDYICDVKFKDIKNKK